MTLLSDVFETQVQRNINLDRVSFRRPPRNGLERGTSPHQHASCKS
jgi:hypothetical protein